MNYRTVRITAQIHRDDWYSDTNGAGRGRRQAAAGAGVGVPRPLLGERGGRRGRRCSSRSSRAPLDGRTGARRSRLTVGFAAPAAPDAGAPGIPLVSLAAAVGNGGTLAARADALLRGERGGWRRARRARFRSWCGPAFRREQTTTAVTLNGLSFRAGDGRVSRVPRDEPGADAARSRRTRRRRRSSRTPGCPTERRRRRIANYDHANFYWRLETAAGVARRRSTRRRRWGTTRSRWRRTSTAAMSARIYAGQGRRAGADD